MKPAIIALERLSAGDWEGAHELVQNLTDRHACLVHALLHRHEGDLANADYWYRQAGEERPVNSLDEEWHRLMRLPD
ncbi:MAG: hypothetical protein ACFHX7_23220 [Pseudomonadota bacterium]